MSGENGGYRIVAPREQHPTMVNPSFMLRSRAAGEVSCFDSVNRWRVRGSPSLREELPRKLSLFLPRLFTSVMLGTHPKNEVVGLGKGLGVQPEPCALDLERSGRHTKKCPS